MHPRDAAATAPGDYCATRNPLLGTRPANVDAPLRRPALARVLWPGPNLFDHMAFAIAPKMIAPMPPPRGGGDVGKSEDRHPANG